MTFNELFTSKASISVRSPLQRDAVIKYCIDNNINYSSIRYSWANYGLLMRNNGKLYMEYTNDCRNIPFEFIEFDKPITVNSDNFYFSYYHSIKTNGFRVASYKNKLKSIQNKLLKDGKNKEQIDIVSNILKDINKFRYPKKTEV